MKKTVLISAILLMACNFLIQAQTNLVLNPSFENHTACPTNLGQVDYVVGWDTCRGSADYFNSCATSTFMQAPQNYFGYQQPASGNGYCGFATYSENGLDREIIIGQLTAPLVVFQKYYISFMVSRADSTYINGYNTNKLGVKFSKVKQNNVSINNVAHYYSNTIISDTINWTRIFGSFIADSTYQYIMLGNFFDDANTTVVKIGPGIAGYYFVDDVCLSTDSTYASNYVTGIKEPLKKQMVEIFPNPTADYFIIKNYSNLKLKIFDSYGNEINYQFEINQNTLKINCSLWNNGVYYIKTNYGTNKLIINH